MSILIPPNSSFRYELERISAYIEPINNILEELSKESIIIKIIDTNDWSNKSEKRALSQDLKIQDVEELIKVKMERGVSKIKTCTITYLKE